MPTSKIKKASPKDLIWAGSVQWESGNGSPTYAYVFGLDESAVETALQHLQSAVTQKEFQENYSAWVPWLGQSKKTSQEEIFEGIEESIRVRGPSRHQLDEMWFEGAHMPEVLQRIETEPLVIDLPILSFDDLAPYCQNPEALKPFVIGVQNADLEQVYNMANVHQQRTSMIYHKPSQRRISSTRLSYEDVRQILIRWADNELVEFFADRWERFPEAYQHMTTIVDGIETKLDTYHEYQNAGGDPARWQVPIDALLHAKDEILLRYEEAGDQNRSSSDIQPAYNMANTKESEMTQRKQPTPRRRTMRRKATAKQIRQEVRKRLERRAAGRAEGKPSARRRRPVATDRPERRVSAERVSDMSKDRRRQERLAELQDRREERAHEAKMAELTERREARAREARLAQLREARAERTSRRPVAPTRRVVKKAEVAPPSQKKQIYVKAGNSAGMPEGYYELDEKATRKYQAHIKRTAAAKKASPKKVKKTSKKRRK